MGEENAIAIKKEVEKLVDANFVKEIRFETWVANPILVKNSNEKWKISADFRDLNKAMPLLVHFIENVNEKISQECANFNKAFDWVTPMRVYLESKNCQKAKWRLKGLGIWPQDTK